MSNLYIVSRKGQTCALEGGALNLERPRPGELEAFEKSGLNASLPGEAEATLVRTNPERTTKYQLRALKDAEAKAPVNAIRLNPISSFHNYANKCSTFQIWKTAGLRTPEFMTLPLLGRFSSYEKKLSSLAENGCYLRTSNEDSGKGLLYFPSFNKAQYKKSIWKLRFRTLISKVELTDLLAVKPVNNKVGVLGFIYRVHLVGSDIVGGYAICAEESIIHVRNLSVKYINEFISANNKLVEYLQLPAFSSKIVRALSSLKLHVGAVEFFIINDEPVFLEVNPLWGGKHQFGDKDFRGKLLSVGAPANVELWLNPEMFYQGYWRGIETLIKNQGEYGAVAKINPKMLTSASAGASKCINASETEV